MTVAVLESTDWIYAHRERFLAHEILERNSNPLYSHMTIPLDATQQNQLGSAMIQAIGQTELDENTQYYLVEALAEDSKQQRDKADAKFEMAMGTMDSSLDSGYQSKASARLEQIRNRLGIKESAETVEPTLELSQEDLKLLEQLD